MARSTNRAGVQLIKQFEGFSSKPYLCPAGRWTIGYGSTQLLDGFPVTQSTPDMPKDAAETLLAHSLKEFEADVARLVTVPLNENQFSALVSFVYNLGSGALAGSTLLKKLNSRDYHTAGLNFPLWCKAKIDGELVTVSGLLRRRLAEKDLFNRPVA